MAETAASVVAQELPLGGDPTDALDSLTAAAAAAATGIDEGELDDELLAEFYAFTYEDAVLVGPAGSPPRPSSPLKHSPLKRPPSPLRRPPSPTRHAGGSPTKPDQQPLATSTGPSASQVAGATAEPPLLAREVLNAMLPLKTWRDAHGKWQRVARMTPSSRTDVVRFEALFGQLLEAHQARASAICPVREKLFLQAFEELIRQSACECPERGLLLLRLRDELRMTVQAYQTLYHNSIAYGRQKAVQAEAGIVELEDRVSELQQTQQQLRERQQQLTHQLWHVEAAANESEQTRARQQRQLMRFLREQHAQLTTFHSELTHDPTWK